MRLSVSNKYPQVYRLTTQGDQNSGGFCGLSVPNKALIHKLKCETLEINVVFINPYCPVIYR